MAPAPPTLDDLATRVLTNLLVNASWEYRRALLQLVNYPGIADLSPGARSTSDNLASPLVLASVYAWLLTLDEEQTRDVVAALLTGTIARAGGRVQPWATACIAADGTHAQYLQDLTVLWDDAERQQNLLLALRCSLLFSRFQRVPRTLPVSLLRQLAAIGTPEGPWSSDAIRRYLQHAGRSSQFASVIEPEEHEPDPVTACLPWELNTVKPEALTPARDALLQEVRRWAQEQADPFVAVQFLSRLASSLPESQALLLCEEALCLLPKVSDAWSSTNNWIGSASERRVRSLTSLSNATGYPWYLRVHTAAVVEAASTPDVEERARLLVELAAYLPVVFHPLLHEAIAVNLPTDRFVQAMFELQLHVHDEGIVKTCLQRACQEPDGVVRARALAILAPHLGASQRALALKAIDEIDAPGWRAFVLATLNPTQPYIIDQVRTIADLRLRTNTLVALLPHLPEDERPLIANEAWHWYLEQYPPLSDPDASYGHNPADNGVIITLAPYLGKRVFYSLAAVLVHAAKTRQSDSLYQLRTSLDRSLLQGALQALNAEVPDPDDRLDVLLSLCELWPFDYYRRGCPADDIWQAAFDLVFALHVDSGVNLAVVSARHARLICRLIATTPVNVTAVDALARRSTTIPSRFYRADVLITLIARWRLSLRTDNLYDEALRLAQSTDWLPLAECGDAAPEQPESLIRLLGLLPLAQRERIVPEVLERILRHRDEWGFAPTLAALIPWIADQHIPRVESVLWHIDSPRDQAIVLHSLAPRLPDTRRGLAWAKAVLWACAEQEPSLRRERIATLISSTPAAFRPALLSAFCRTEGDASEQLNGDGTDLLHQWTLGSWLPESSKESPHLHRLFQFARADMALRYAQSTADVRERLASLLAIASSLSMGQMVVVQQEALSTLEAQDEALRAQFIVDHVADLPAPVLPRVIAMVAAIKDGQRRANAIVALAPNLPTPLLPQLLAAARGVREPLARAQSLIALIARQRSDARTTLLADLLVAMGSVADAETRVRLCTQTISVSPPHIQQALVENALRMARAIEGPEIQARSLALLIPHLPAELAETVSDDALRVARAVTDDDARMKLLLAIAPNLWSHRGSIAVARALAIAGKQSNVPLRGQSTTPSYSPRTRPAAEVSSSAQPQELLAVQSEHLDATLAIETELQRVHALGRLAPSLSYDQLAAVLQIGTRIGTYWLRAELIILLAPYLDPDHLPAALALARTIPLESSRANALAALLDRVPTEMQQTLYQEVRGLLNVVTNAAIRDSIIRYLAVSVRPKDASDLLNVALSQVASPALIDGIAQLLPHLNSADRKRLLSYSRGLPDERRRVDLLITLAPYLGMPQLIEVITIIVTGAADVIAPDSLRRLIPIILDRLALYPEEQPQLTMSILSLLRPQKGAVSESLRQVAYTIAPLIMTITRPEERPYIEQAVHQLVAIRL